MTVILFILSFLIHDYHVCKTDINYDLESSSIQVTSHIFIDDLEEELSAAGIDKLYLGTKKEVSIADSVLIEYFSDHLKLKLDDRDVTYSFVGKELSEDLIALWCYFEVSNVSNLSSLEIENSILIDSFSDQMNIMAIFKNNKRTEFELLKKSKQTMSASF